MRGPLEQHWGYKYGTYVRIQEGGWKLKERV